MGTVKVDGTALEALKSYVDKEVRNAHADYEMSGMFSSGARHEHYEEMKKIQKMVNNLDLGTSEDAEQERLGLE